MIYFQFCKASLGLQFLINIFLKKSIDLVWKLCYILSTKINKGIYRKGG